MEVVGRRKRNQPAPPHVLFGSLTAPHRGQGREWLFLQGDETEPAVLEAEPHRVVYSSIWPDRPDDRIEFLLAPDGGHGTDLEWLLWSNPDLDERRTKHCFQRIQELVNRDLRESFGQ